MVGIFLITAGVISLLGLVRLTSGGLVDPWIRLLESWLGWGAIIIPVTILAGGLVLLSARSQDLLWGRILALELLLFALLGLLSGILADGLPEAEIGEGGGIVGWSIARSLGSMFGRFGRLIVLALLAVGAVYLIVRRGVRKNSVPAPVVEEKEQTKESEAVPPQYQKRFKVTTTTANPEPRSFCAHSLTFPAMLCAP